MELQQLKYFLDIAQTQNMTASSKRLNVAQPALSHSMKRLESELGVTLFDRVGRNIRLSRAGEHFEGLLKPAMSILDDAPGRVRAFSKGEQRTVVVGMHSASKLVIAAIAEYKAANPEALFRISQDAYDFCDVTVRTAGTAGSAVPAGAEARLFRERIGVALPANLGIDHVGSLDELEGRQFVTLAGSKGFRRVCDELCAARGFVVGNAIESDSPDAVRELIGLGLGVGFWPEFSWGGLEGSSARFAPIADEGFVRCLEVRLEPRADESPEARRFFEFTAAFVDDAFSAQSS